MSESLLDLFARARDMAPEARERLLDELAAANEARAVQLRRLLAAAEVGASPLDCAPWLAWVDEDAEDADLPLPERIGPYRILRELGRGGMGRVFLAEEETADFRRTVALKVIDRPGGDADAVRRFRDEVRILASLEDPGIARFLDGGRAPDGTWFLALEHVEGEDILAYARQHGLDARQRVELFVTALDAVHHAHERGIVHRDLKPANLLVGKDGRPRLLDFGISKLVDAEGDAGVLTRTQARALTPAYASPEQFRGERVTPAADVYSLGVLLYELLTERRPFAGASGSAVALEREVLEREPAPPSRSATRTGRFGRDLDAICLRALRKPPAARYANAGAFAADLRRYLAGQPVEARQGGRRYRATRLLERHRGNLSMVAALIVVVSGLAIAAVAYHHLRLAPPRGAQTTSTAAFEVLAEANDLYRTGRYREAIPRLEREVAENARYAEAWALLGKSYARVSQGSSLDNMAQAEYQRKAMRAAERAVALSPSLAEAHVALALANRAGDRVDAWRAAARQAIAADPRLAEAHVLLGDVYNMAPTWGCLRRRDLTLAESSYRRAIALDPQLGVAHTNLAYHLVWSGRERDALATADAAHAALPNDVTLMRARATALLWLSRADDAERQLVAIAGLTTTSVQDEWELAAVELLRGHAVAAAPRLRATLARGPLPLRAIDTGRIYCNVGRTQEAASYLDEAFAADRACAEFVELSPAFAACRQHPEIAAAIEKSLKAASPPAISLAMSEATGLYTRGRYRESIQRLEPVVAERPDDAAAWALLGKSYARVIQGPTLDTIALREYQQKSLRAAERAARLDPSLADAQVALGLAYRSLEQPDEWRSAAERAIAADPRLAEAHVLLGSFYAMNPTHGCARQRDSKLAEAAYRRAVEVDPSLRMADSGMTFHLIWSGREREALATVDQALSAQPDNVALMRARAAVLVWLSRPDDLEQQLLRIADSSSTTVQDEWELGAVDLLRGRPDDAAPRFRAAMKRGPRTLRGLQTARIYCKVGQMQEAASYLEEVFAGDPSCAKYIQQSPVFAACRKDPAIAATLQRHSSSGARPGGAR